MYYCGSSSTFIPRDLIDGTLYLRDVETLARDWHHVTEDGLDFAQFVLVAGDEVQFFGRHVVDDGAVAMMFVTAVA